MIDGPALALYSLAYRFRSQIVSKWPEAVNMGSLQNLRDIGPMLVISYDSRNYLKKNNRIFCSLLVKAEDCAFRVARDRIPGKPIFEGKEREYLV